MDSDSEMMIESENNPERLTKVTPILKSVENKDVESVTSSIKKEKAKDILNPQWLLDSQCRSFSLEYRPDSNKVLCVACNEPFSIRYGEENDIDRHTKLKRHIDNMKSLSINRQLIIPTMKPNKESEDI